MDNDFTPNRQCWGVELRIDSLLKAAARKEQFHRGRVDHWKREREMQWERLRTEGIKTNISEEEFEKLVASYSSNYRNAPGGITLDQDIVQKVQEAERKAKEHVAHVEDLQRWQQTLEVFAAAGESHLEADHEAISFFRVHPEDLVV